MQPPPMPIPSMPTAAPALSPEQLAQLMAARQKWKPIHRSARIATFYAWATALFAALTLLTALFSLVGLIVGVVMAVVAYGEFRGAAELKRLDPNAPRHLGYSQLLLAALLLVYAVFMTWRYTHDPSTVR